MSTEEKFDGQKPKHSYGWIKDPPIDEVFMTRFTARSANTYMDSAGMNFTVDNMPPVFNLLTTLKSPFPDCQKPYNQETIGSCSAQGGVFAFVFEQLKQQNINPIMPSRLDLYYKSRAAQGNINKDSGATISGMMNVLTTEDLCLEKDWPYDVSKYQQNAPDTKYDGLFRGLSAQRIDLSNDNTQTAIINQLKTALLSGQPIVFGFMVSESFESDATKRTGMMPIPLPTERIVGGHCVDIIGYDDSKQSMLCRNSWGTEWGLEGNFYMPYQFVADKSKCFDFWILTAVSTPIFSPPGGYDISYLTPINVAPGPKPPGPGPPGPQPPGPQPPGPQPPKPQPPGPQPQPLPPQPQPWPPQPQPLPQPWPPQPWPPQPQPLPQPWPPQPFPPQPWPQPWPPQPRPQPFPPQPFPRPRPFPGPRPRPFPRRNGGGENE